MTATAEVITIYLSLRRSS